MPTGEQWFHVVLFVFLAVFGAYRIRRLIRMKMNSAFTTARVTKVKRRLWLSISYEFKFTYRVRGITYYTSPSTTSIFKTYNTGDVVKIIYNKKKPKDMDVADTVGYLILPFLAFLLGISGIIFCVIFIWGA